MKNLDTGEVTPPLPHEEWIDQQREVEAQRAKAQASSSRKSKAAAGNDEGDDRTLHGHKLSVYRRQVGDKTGDERLALLAEKNSGIGEVKAREIADALDNAT